MPPAADQGADFYHLLGVARDAGADEIKRAYRRKAREMHPDLDPGNPWAEDDFKALSAAYQVLSDPDKRARYDQGDWRESGGRRARSGSTETPGDKGAKRGFGAFFRDRAPPDIDGVDVNYTLKVGFLEAARGAHREIKTTHGATLKVTVPPGTLDGQVLRLRGQGMRGFGAGRDGDALVEIEVEPHPLFACKGRDVFTEAPVPLRDAVLGGRIEVETIDGLVNVTVPPNSNTGTRLRLKGRGLADGGRKDGSRGDHYVSLVVTLPKDPDPALAEFLRDREAP